MTNFDLNLLVVFNEVARYESITKASEKLFVSQPAISQSIKKLESSLGESLLVRSNKGIRLTEEGKNFYEYVQVALSLIEKGVDEFQNFKQLEKGTIHVGISTALTKIVLIQVLADFMKAYPNLKIKITNDLSSNLLSGLANNLYDFVIFNDHGEEIGQFDTMKLSRLEYCFAYNPMFFDIENSLSIEKLKNLPLILQKKGSNTRIFVDKIVGQDFEPHMEVVSQELVQLFTRQGLGVGLIYKNMINFKESDLVEIKLKTPLPSTNITLAQNKNKALTIACKEFKKFITKKINRKELE